MWEVILWVGLIAWLWYLALSDGRLGSAGMAMALCGASSLAVAGMFVATQRWPEPEAFEAARLLLWLAFALGLSGVVMWLRHRSDGGDGPGDGANEPEPPWWPEFERDFNEWARQRSTTRPRQPVR